MFPSISTTCRFARCSQAVSNKTRCAQKTTTGGKVRRVASTGDNFHLSRNSFLAESLSSNLRVFKHSDRKQVVHCSTGEVSVGESAADSQKKSMSAKVVLGGLMVAIGAFSWSHAYSGVTRLASSVFLSLLISVGGYKKKSLSFDGAISAFVVGLVTCYASFQMGVTLVMFFVSSSALTKLRPDIKKKTDEDFKEGGQRNIVQVAANGGVPTVVALLAAMLSTYVDPFFIANQSPQVCGCMYAFVAYYSCCCGDTWASELGVLSKSPPRLITTFQEVPAGTNGGVSFLGTLASGLGGLFVGTCFFLSGALTSLSSPAGKGLIQWYALPLGLVAGLLGSFVDSLLGATIQFSGFDEKRNKITGTPGPNVRHISGLRILSNHAVNFVSAACIALIAFCVGTWAKVI